MSPATLSDLFDALDRSETVVLPNARAARQLRSSFDARQRLRGLQVWTPPRVLSWQQWTLSQWSELVVAGAEQRLLLNTAQERSLWAEILSSDTGDGLLSSVESIAELAMASWQLAAGYSATHLLHDPAGNIDSRTFARWSEEFSRLCTAREYLSSALLELALLRHLDAGSMAAPDRLMLAGFIQMLPARDALLDGLRRRGSCVTEVQLEAGTAGDRRLESMMAANEREELLVAARWIRDFMETSRADERRSRVAILVPNLREDRSELEGVLRETLAPELQWIGADLCSAPWEIPGGVPLSSLAMVADALALARWTEAPLPVREVSSLLLSPYIGSNGTSTEDRDASARFDAERLRRLLVLQPEIDIGSVLKLTEIAIRGQHEDVLDWSTATAWIHSMHGFLQITKERSRQRSFAEWMEFVRRLLLTAGWPGKRLLNAAELEIVHAWEGLLDMVSTLDFSGHRISFTEALQALTVQARRTMFSPPSNDAPVQVMSVAEAEGSNFDAVVFLRCTDANWPASERMNPLLPWGLQHRLKMPGTDPAGSTERSRAFTEDLTRRSASLLFTFAAENESGTLRPSPLLKEFHMERGSLETAAVLEAGVASIAMEMYPDQIDLPPLPSSEVGGGAAVLKLQAACGFLAFADLRLHATEPQLGDIGFDERESGRWLHRAMQQFWTLVGSQDELRQLSFTRRDDLLKAAIDEAMPRRLPVRDAWDRAYVALQKDRMRSLLQRWLDEELQRGPFSIFATEKEEPLAVGPLTLTVRMDRIDKVGDGFLLVDYKTGYAADLKHWDGDRPDEPQLPLYTLHFEADEVKGLAFAKIRAGRDMKWVGYHAEEGVLPKAKVRNFASLIEEWRSALTRLAEDFAAGRADVNPKNFEINCKRCAQRLLCRVDAGAVQAVMTGVEEEGEGMDG
jgi:probable DNA repair protein